jgi:hypothetical protein
MRVFTIIALALAIGLATAASPFASSRPDGLERVATDHGFAAKRQGSADYGDTRLDRGLAGFTGTLLVFALGYGVAAVARRRPTPA